MLESLARQHGFISAGSVSLIQLKKLLSKKFSSTEKILENLPENTESLLVFFHPYPPGGNPGFSDYSGRIKIARFTWMVDYHHILKDKLKSIAGRLTELSGAEHVWWGSDNHPLPEKELAEMAGLGAKGKNSLLITSKGGSLGFLGIIASPIEIDREGKDKNIAGSSDKLEEYCQKCGLCIKHCPVDALMEEDGQVNRSLCISSLTQQRGKMQWSLAETMENHFWGCDICQNVCPFNRSVSTAEICQKISSFPLQMWPSVEDLEVKKILQLFDRDLSTEWERYVFSWQGSRILVRNLLIVLGNNGIPVYEDIIENISCSRSPVLRYFACYCLYRWKWQIDKRLANNFLEERASLENDEENAGYFRTVANCREEFIDAGCNY